jgi:hypothetical protein
VTFKNNSFPKTTLNKIKLIVWLKYRTKSKFLKIGREMLGISPEARRASCSLLYLKSTVQSKPGEGIV